MHLRKVVAVGWQVLHSMQWVPLKYVFSRSQVQTVLTIVPGWQTPLLVVPGGHTLHGMHCAHEILVADLLKLPVLHGMHSSVLEAPMPVEYVADAQRMHTVEPITVLYVPGLQLLQAEDALSVL